MIKVMVVIYGLVMFVPQQDGSLRTLFVEASDSSHGEHTPVLHWLGADGNLKEVWRPSGEFQVTIKSSDGEVRLGARQDFLQLEDLFDYPHRGLIREECVLNNSCPGVKGTLDLQGDWGTRPATYCNGGFNPPVRFDDPARFDLVRWIPSYLSWITPLNKTHTLPTRRLATALRLDTEISGVADLEILVEGRVWDKGERYQVVEVNPESDENPCEEWIGEPADRCIVLLIGNPPDEEIRHDSSCQTIDRHFSALFSVTNNPPMKINRWLPYAYASAGCPEGYPDRKDDCKKKELGGKGNYKIRNKPAVRCPPAFATVEWETETQE